MSRRIPLALSLLLVGSQINLTQQTAIAQTPTQPVQTPTQPAQTPKTFCPNELGNNIDAVVNLPQFNRVRWGILVQGLSSGQTLYSRDAQKYFIPASNTKLLTTSAALQQFGANYRIRTSIYQESDGVLRVVGRGDPSLTDAQLKTLAQQLKKRGITKINKLIADDSYFQGDIVHPSWQWEDLQSDYGAPVSSFTVNENLFQISLVPKTLGQPLEISWTDPNEARIWRVVNQTVTVAADQPSGINVTRDLSGNVLLISGQLAANAKPFPVDLPVVDPNYYFLRRFRTALAAEGIALRETTVGIGTSVQEIASVDSPPLSQLITTTNVDSNNLFAEALLRTLAIKQPKKPNQATADAGMEVLKTTLTSLGVNPTSYVIQDGSGLSRKNLISPEALVQLLQAIAKSPNGTLYRASLPVGGKSGTLKNRFRNTIAEGIVFAKTGTVGGVVALSGYLNAPNYEPLVFSIIVNQSELGSRDLRKAVDDIVVTMTQLQRC